MGIELADQCKAEGVALVGTGEMGIGNTTPSSAIIAAISGIPVRELTHRGTGINNAALENKIRIIEKGLALNQPDPKDPLDVLAKVGGLEIAAIAGLVLGCAANAIAGGNRRIHIHRRGADSFRTASQRPRLYFCRA